MYGPPFSALTIRPSPPTRLSPPSSPCSHAIDGKTSVRCSKAISDKKLNFCDDHKGLAPQ